MAARIRRIQSPEAEVAEAPPRPEPLRVVRRELTTPDGRKVVVDVPVYPPFRLEARAPGDLGAASRTPKRARGRSPSSEPRLRSRRGAKAGTARRERR